MSDIYYVLKKNFDLAEFINIHFKDLEIPNNATSTLDFEFDFEFDHSILKSNFEIDWNCIIRYCPLTDEEIDEYFDKLFKNEKLLYSSSLSENKNVKWNYSILEKYQKQFNWYKLAENPSVPWDEYLIDKYILGLNNDTLHWQYLSSNPSINWNYDLIKKYWSKLNLFCIIKYSNIYWDNSLLNKTLDLMEEEELEYYLTLFSEISNVQWDLETLIKFPNSKYKLEYPYYYNPWFGNILKNNTMKLSFIELENKFSLLTKEIFREIQVLNNLIWDKNSIDKYIEFIDFKILSKSKNVNWNLSLIIEYSQYFDFDWLSSNRNIPFDHNYLNNHNLKWNYLLLSKNPSVLWTQELIERNIEEVDLISIYTSNKIFFDEEFIHKYRYKIIWKGKDRRFGSDNTLYEACEISMLVHIPIGIETLVECAEKWLIGTGWHDESHNHFSDWYYFSRNNYLSSNHLEIFKDKLNWDNISSNMSIKLDDNLIEKYSNKLNMDIVLKRGDLTSELFLCISKYLTYEILMANKENCIKFLEPYDSKISTYLNYTERYFHINNKLESKNYFSRNSFSFVKKEYLDNCTKQFHLDLSIEALHEYEKCFSTLLDDENQQNDIKNWLNKYFNLFEDISFVSQKFERELIYKKEPNPRIYTNQLNIGTFFYKYKNTLRDFKKKYELKFGDK